ncbi:MAG: hypothetical protein LBP65_00015 [Puniceicoccales bacterium]|nr:hypothetical protein [Puniceicoccales bacterium]
MSELNALRGAMCGKRVSQPKFAKLLGLSRDIIAGIEIGIRRLTPNIARRIRSCTGCMIFSAEEKGRASGWENLPLRDFIGRPYSPTSYREWCAWKALLDVRGTVYRSHFLGEAIGIFSTALRQIDWEVPTELRNNGLLNFWNRIADVLLDLLNEPAVAKEVERMLAQMFGEGGQENFFTFLHCLHGVALPVEGEFAAFCESDGGENPHDSHAASATIHAIIRSMCTFRRWRAAEFGTNCVEVERAGSDLETMMAALRDEYERGNISEETFAKLTANDSPKTRHSHMVQNPAKTHPIPGKADQK